MRTRALVIVVLAGAMGYGAGRGVLPPAWASMPRVALAPFAVAPAEGVPSTYSIRLVNVDFRLA
jgi:hypothetical protein